MTGQGVDPSGQGRWSYMILSGRATDIMFISAYRVCQKASAKVGPLTSFAQQWTMSCVADKEGPDSGKDFIIDLIQFVKEQRNDRQLAVSILMDANELLGTEPDGIQKLTETLQLTDIQSTNSGLMDQPLTSEARTASTMASFHQKSFRISDAAASGPSKTGLLLTIGGHTLTSPSVPCSAVILLQLNILPLKISKATPPKRLPNKGKFSIVTFTIILSCSTKLMPRTGPPSMNSNSTTSMTESLKACSRPKSKLVGLDDYPGPPPSRSNR